MSHVDQPQILLKKGITAAKAGDKALSRKLLLKLLESEPANEQVWLWLAYVAESLEERVAYLQQSLSINPHNSRAAAALKQLRRQLAKPTWRCPLCQAEAEQMQTTCDACGAVLTLDDLDEVLNSKVAAETLSDAIERYLDTADLETDARANYFIGVAYLNLKQLERSLPYLQKALRMRAKDHALEIKVRELQERLRPPEQESTLVEEETDEPKDLGTVLVVDDSATIRKLVSMTLGRNGYTVLSANDGLEALAQLNDKMPDLILLDITMPRMDGYQLCKVVKGNEATADIPVVMLSGKDGFFDKVRGRMVGATAYITKPFEPQILLTEVKTHIRRLVAA